jgi:hypothetical protein
MAQTKLNATDLLKAGSVARTHLDTSTAGAAIIAKVIAGAGITLTSTGADAGTGDVTLSANGAAPTNAVKIGDTTPSGAAVGQIVYSTAACCPVFWTGDVWAPAVALPYVLAMLAAGLVDGSSGVAPVDLGDLTKVILGTGIGGFYPLPLTDLGTVNGNVFAAVDLGSVT